MERTRCRWSAAAVVVLAVAAPATAWGQDASASGSLGVGMFGTDPATTIDVGLDAAGEGYAVGLGARLRYLAGSGVRSEDWDQASEVARLIRYLQLEHDGEVQAAVALGELGGLTLGNGAMVDGYTSGLDVDHGHLGVSSRLRWSRYAAEVFADDVIAPRIVGARATAEIDRVVVGGGATADLSVPVVAGVPVMEGGSHVVPLIGASAETRVATEDGRAGGRVYGELVVAPRTGGGLHLGGAGDVALGSARLAARAEGRFSSDGYAPGWIGPLYERRRADLYAQARAGGLGGLGGFGSLLEVGVDVPEVGSATASYAWRVGLPELALARISAPHFRGVQGAVWAAVEVGGPDPARAMALEARVRLPSKMFVVVEAARLYRRADVMVELEPIWIATAGIGAVVGE